MVWVRVKSELGADVLLPTHHTTPPAPRKSGSQSRGLRGARGVKNSVNGGQNGSHCPGNERCVVDCALSLLLLASVVELPAPTAPPHLEQPEEQSRGKRSKVIRKQFDNSIPR
jgi:hypothetical protein